MAVGYLLVIAHQIPDARKEMANEEHDEHNSDDLDQPQNRRQLLRVAVQNTLDSRQPQQLRQAHQAQHFEKLEILGDHARLRFNYIYTRKVRAPG